MTRIDLNVPFGEKDDAKRLGAKWDGERKVWYVPDGVDRDAFARWLPDDSNFTVRAERYFIARSHTYCWKCSELTPVYGFVLDDDHEILEPDEEDDAQDVWYQPGEPTIVHYVHELAPQVAERVKALTRHYRPDFSKTTSSTYWMNHCASCGMKQGDFQLFCEPGGAFCPVDERTASRIVLQPVAEPFAASADVSYGDHFFEDMRQA